MKKIILPVIIVLLFAISPAIAGTQSGQSEIQFQGQFQNITNSEDDDSMDILVGMVAYNVFLKDNISVGGTVMINRNTTDDTTNSTIFLMGNADYYLGTPASEVVPYVGARLGIASYTMETDNYDESGSSLSYGVHGGIKYFLMENVSFNGELDYSIYEQEFDDDTITINTLSLLIGLSYYF